MTLRKTSIALGTAVVALAAASVADTASAQAPNRVGGTTNVIPFDDPIFRGPRIEPPHNPVPQPPTSALNRDMRGSPDKGGGRGMRGMGGGRMNGGMRRR